MRSKINFMVIIIVTLLSLNISLSTRAEVVQINYVGHHRSVNSAYWNPDETIIASGSNDGHIIIWNSSNAEILNKVNLGSIGSVRWNSDGTKILAIGLKTVVHIWDLSTLKSDNITFSNSSVSVNIADWSYDDKQIAIGTSNGEVLVFDLDGNLQKSLNLTAGGIMDLDYHPEKDLIAVSYANGSLIIWNSSSNETNRIDYTNAVTSLSWNRDGSLLLAGENTNIHFLSETGEEQVSINNEPSKIAAFSLNKNESLLATGSTTGNVNIWSLLSNSKIKFFNVLPNREGESGYFLNNILINSLDWNNDDKLLVATPSRQFDLWDINTEINELVFGTAETILEKTTFPVILFLPLLILLLIRKYKKKFNDSGGSL